MAYGISVRRLTRITWTAVLLLVASTSCRREEPADFDRLMNLGQAYLENRDAKHAVQTLTKAVKLAPTSGPALRNLARGQLLAGSNEEALATLRRARKQSPQSPAVRYLIAMAHIHLGHMAEARTELEATARSDPDSATVRFQLAKVYEVMGQAGKAVEQLRETARLDPLHASAQYALATYARKAGDRAAFERRYRAFMRLRKIFGNETRSASALEQCRYTRPESAPRPEPDRASALSKAIPIRFVDASAEAFASEADRFASACGVMEVDAQGYPVLFVVDPGDVSGLLKMTSRGLFQRTTLSLDSATLAGVTQCVVGDFHDDVPKGVKYDPRKHARNDVLLVTGEGLRLLQRKSATSLVDVTKRAGLEGRSTHRAAWIDYEHDGDLDLLLARETGLELWQNNGDGTFANITETVGVTVTGRTVDVAMADLDSNVAVDLVVAGDNNPTQVFMNQRAGRFARLPEPPGPWPLAKRVLLDDLNNDGRVDALLLREKGVWVLYGGSFPRQRIEFPDIVPVDVSLFDFDNDGWLDLCVAGRARSAADRGVVRLWRNEGGLGWSSASRETGLMEMSMPPLSHLIPADFDADGDTDFILQDADQRLWFLRNEGGDVNGQLKIRLLATKSNPSGFGARIELRDRAFLVTRSISRVPIAIGLAGRKRLDSVRVEWTNGVLDNQIDVKPGKEHLTILEKNVPTGSCPFLYAWEGSRFRFVTDILGNSPMGLSLRRDVPLPADPDEIVVVGAASSAPSRDGSYTFEITDEFREIFYLDQARLLAVDHPADVEVHSTDKIMPPPFPPSRIMGLSDPKPLVRAVGDEGIDRTDALREIDGRFAPPGPPQPSPFRGMCYPMSITLDFGEVDGTKSLVLALTGWLQYGDASTNIAMSQNPSMTILAPVLEVETAPGVWSVVDATVGMPAGKTKTILCDLSGKLPKRLSRLRLTTTFEIRWDRIALMEKTVPGASRRYDLSPTGADLYFRGFSDIRKWKPGHPHTPHYEEVSSRPPWRLTPQGWCTRYGDVRELLLQRDDKLVIMNAGDALTLHFEAGSLPPVLPGMKRTLLFYSVGWDKDQDHNVITGDTVEPLPMEHRPQGRKELKEGVTEDDWRLQYNTRWVPLRRFSTAE